jgi:ABC-type multidrug transport system ATPase subunit
MKAAVEAAALHVSAPGRGKTPLLLSNISFSINHGTFAAVIGPSGCGKSTLLKVIAGLEKQASGGIALAGHPPQWLRQRLPLVIGYLPQFSAFHQELTVRESLVTSQRLRKNSRATREGEAQQLAAVVNFTRLDCQLEQPVGTLSGGQLRKMALAEDLLGDPPFLFLDELTSGLDPHAEREMMHWLAELARQTGKTVVLVTHAINNLHLCNQILFLNRGQLLYDGPPEHFLHHFGKETVEDIYECADQFIAPLSEAPLNQSTTEPQPLRFAQPASFFRQLPVLAIRQAKLLWRDKGQLWLQVLLVFTFPALVAVFALNGLPEVKRLSLRVQTNVVESLAEKLQYISESFQVSSLVAGLSMFEVILLTLMGANNAAREIAKERQVLGKELRAGLSPGAYLLTKAGQVFLFSLLQAAWMALFVKTMCGFPGLLGEQFLILFLATLSMSCTCLLFSAISSTPERASLLSIYLVGLQLPLSGAVLALPEWLKWMARPFTTAYWGWSGYLRTFEEYRHFDIVKQTTKTDIASFKLSIIVLSLHVIVTLAAALFALHRKRRESLA